MTEKRVSVYWKDCDCEWITKYCEGYHFKQALVPASVLETYRKENR